MKDDTGPLLDPLTQTLPPRGRVIRWVSAAIGSGKLRIGQPLPSERVLAERLGVSRTAVRAALDEMAAEGAIDRPNGGRLRRVARVLPDPQGRNLMNDSLAIVSNVMLPTGNVGTGFQELYIKHQASVSIEAAGMHAMGIHPSRVLEMGIDQFLTHPPAGLLVVDEVAAGSQVHTLLKAVKGILPVVVHGAVPDMEDYDRVITDHYAGGKALTRWLIERGRRKILRVWLSDSNHYWLDRRSEGYVDGMREAGLEPLPVLRVPAGDRFSAVLLNTPPDAQPKVWNDQVRHIAGYLIDWFADPHQRPDAVMCMTDGHCVHVAAALRVFGIEPGRDVLLTGYDNNWHLVPYLRFESARPAATVEKHNAQCAQAMVQMLLDRIAGKLPPEPQCQCVAHELRVLEQASD